MKSVAVDRGSRRETIAVPDDAQVLEYVEQPPAGDPHVLVERALDAPSGLPPLLKVPKCGVSAQSRPM